MKPDIGLSEVFTTVSMQALGEGPRQRRRMDAAKPLYIKFVPPYELMRHTIPSGAARSP